jgi:hypothetical protein
MRGESDEGEGKGALETIWNADNGCFGDGRVRSDGLFDGACIC